MTNKQITVLGRFNVDFVARTPHIPVAGETIKAIDFEIRPGGKGFNQAIAAERAGGRVILVTRIGKDELSPIALRYFASEQMDTTFVFQDEEHSTGVALIMVDETEGENIITITPSACDYIGEEDLERARVLIENSAILLTQLEVNFKAVQKAVDIAKVKGVKIILNPAPAQPLPDELIRKIDILTPNETEASILCGVPVNTLADAKKAAKILVQRGVETAVITLGSKGSLVATPSGEHFIKALKVKAVDTVGAGDVYNGALAAAITEGRSILEAAEFATVAASLKVAQRGVIGAMPHRDQIERLMH